MHEKLNLGLAVIAMASLTALLIYHAKASTAVTLPNVPPPVGTTPNTDPSYKALPSYLTYNLPPYGPAETSWIPNLANPYVPPPPANAGSVL